MCYTGRMVEVASRVLRNELRKVLEQVESGKQVTITVSGRPVAVLQPVHSRSPWVPRADFIRLLRNSQADPALTQTLRELAPDDTDSLPL